MGRYDYPDWVPKDYVPMTIKKCREALDKRDPKFSTKELMEWLK